MPTIPAAGAPRNIPRSRTPAGNGRDPAARTARCSRPGAATPNPGIRPTSRRRIRCPPCPSRYCRIWAALPRELRPAPGRACEPQRSPRLRGQPPRISHDTPDHPAPAFPPLQHPIQQVPGPFPPAPQVVPNRRRRTSAVLGTGSRPRIPAARYLRDQRSRIAGIGTRRGRTTCLGPRPIPYTGRRPEPDRSIDHPARPVTRRTRWMPACRVILRPRQTSRFRTPGTKVIGRTG